MARRFISLALAAASVLACGTATAQSRVELTWMSIANWDMKINDKRVMMDAYISRLPASLFVPAPGYPNDMYTFTKGPAGVDMDSIRKVHEAEVGTAKVDYLLAGHAHWDHSWDTPAWSRLTGAPMVGGASACLQAAAQGVPAAQCRTVNGGEKIDLGDGITMRVVRWNHSGDTTNPIQHFARELYRPPVPDPATGGLRAGVGEDYPNGGGNRAFLFTIDRGGERLSFFINNSASAFDLDKDIVVDGVNHGSPLGHAHAVPRPHRPARASRVAEAAVRRAVAPRRVVRAFRRHRRRVQQHRSSTARAPGCTSTRPAPAPTCAATRARCRWRWPTCARWSGRARACSTAPTCSRWS
jgi:hypothetical protein